ncbi:hypothetical protein A6A06_16450 [Streptomyces sp. CB02923]|nr:hypothetical protein A6A06_16450 [Streptomyces sp. CB02923]
MARRGFPLTEILAVGTTALSASGVGASTFTVGLPEAFSGENALLMDFSPRAIFCVAAALHFWGLAAFGAVSLPGTVDSRHARFASFSITALTQAPTVEDTVDWSPACALEPSPGASPEWPDALPAGAGLLLCEAEEEEGEEEGELPEHAAMSGVAVSNVAAAAQPMTLLPDSGRAMTFCSLRVRVFPPDRYPRVVICR